MAQTLLTWCGYECLHRGTQRVQLFSKLGGSFLGSMRQQRPDEAQKVFLKRVKKHAARLMPHHLGFTWRSVELEVVEVGCKVLVGWSTTKAVQRVAKKHMTEVNDPAEVQDLYLHILPSCRKVVEEVGVFQSAICCSISGAYSTEPAFVDLKVLSRLSSLQRLSLAKGCFDLRGIASPGLDQVRLEGARVANFLSLPATLDAIVAKDVQLDDILFQGVVRCFPSLEILILKDVGLNGIIPSELGCLKLCKLKVFRNNLEHSIPSELGNTTTLEVLNLKANRLVGAIPSEIFSLPDLQSLNLSSNQLTGRIIASSFGEQLYDLNLADNRLGGEIPLALSLAATLEFVNLSNNQLVGAIPSRLLSLPNLISLKLASNQLSGKIPTIIGQELRILDLRRNQLSGTIPVFEGPRLKKILLQQNYLTGAIPSGLARLECLAFVDVSHNLLSGTIPTELGQLRGTAVVDDSCELLASHNRLSGTLPHELLRNFDVLDLSHNRLSGSLPSEILSRRMTIDLSHNRLSGPLPDWSEPVKFNLEANRF